MGRESFCLVQNGGPNMDISYGRWQDANDIYNRRCQEYCIFTLLLVFAHCTGFG